MADGSFSVTDEQREIAATFFQLQESTGFAVVGGGALLALGLVDRPTQDLDFFTEHGERVRSASDALRRALQAKGWACTVARDLETFQRLVVVRDDVTVSVDLAMDSAPRRPVVRSILGPTLDPIELGARKVLALFDRAAPRDFVDVERMASAFGKDALVELATEIDLGFDRRIFASALRTVDRIADEDFPCASVQVVGLRGFVHAWADELDASG